MLRILTWNANTGFEKQSDDLQLVGHAAQLPMGSRKNATAKRKRSFDRAVFPERDSLAVKIVTAETTNTASVMTPSSSLATPFTSRASSISASPLITACPLGIVHDEMKPTEEVDCPEKAKSKEEAQLATMRQTISSQISLEILLKHRELRLIDQELAKCQIALEQLRRCSEIPYPSMQQQSSEQASSGKGPAIRKASDKHPARSPAPWGVTDGPYTRHYAKWLLPDAEFDGGEPGMPASNTIGSTPFHGRSTRGHYTDFAQMVGKTSRSQRALNAGLPAGYCEPKQKPTGPMILKRKTDGKMVKLVCPDCARFDFGSAQGFINHCRIGHQRNFASHDAAAEGCGEPIDIDENGTTKDTLPETSAPTTPTVIAVSTPVTPLVATPSMNAAVNPLVRSALLSSKEAMAQPLIKGGHLPKSERKAHKRKTLALPQPCCPETPNLAAFVHARGLDLNVQEAVADAKVKAELPEDYFCEDDMEIDSPLPTPVGHRRHPQVAGSKQPVKSTVTPGIAGKSKFFQNQNRGEVKDSFRSGNAAADDSQFEHSMSLVPSPTNESTQAPSLIDDDEEMDPQSPPSSDETDDVDVHFHVRDDDHSEETNELPSHEVPAPTTTCSQPTTTTQPPLTNHSSFARPLSSKNNDQLRFNAEQPSGNNHNDKKRRKLGE